MTDAQLQRLLESTAASTVYPTTPSLSRAVLARIAVPRSAMRLRPVFIALALLVLALGAALLVPPSRDAIARFFGVQGSSIERLPPSALGTPFPRPASLDTVATPIALADVRGVSTPAVSDKLLQPYIVMYRDQPVVVLHYDRFDLWQTQLPITATFSKQVPPGAEIRDVRVGAVDGRWVIGEHFVYYTVNGQQVLGSQRTVTRNTLIWRTPRAFYRLETALSLDEALQIARTLP
jgi:hypothetical protein